MGWQGSDRNAARTNTMSRFETETLTQEDNLKGLALMNPQWVEPLYIATTSCGSYIWSKGRGGAGSAVRRVNPDRPDWSDAVEAHTWTISLGSCCGRGS